MLTALAGAPSSERGRVLKFTVARALAAMGIDDKLRTLDFTVLAVGTAVLHGIGMWVSYRRQGSESLFLNSRSPPRRSRACTDAL